ncbi:hypothetical protein BC833DRAFT_569191 [Globomyces pollinis-pini]|nr:hypothetical protein BC833DRAFT_569191 [Globomyces pollinis-pini]
MDKFLDRWHSAVLNKDLKLLNSLLHPNIEFHTPLYLKSRKGSGMVTAILASAINIFQDFKYNREWVSQDQLNYCLEFQAIVEGKIIKGVDLIRIDESGRIIHFEVMLRPIKQLARFGELQAEGIPKMIEKLQINAKL